MAKKINKSWNREIEEREHKVQREQMEDEK